MLIFKDNHILVYLNYVYYTMMNDASSVYNTYIFYYMYMYKHYKLTLNTCLTYPRQIECIVHTLFYHYIRELIVPFIIYHTCILL